MEPEGSLPRVQEPAICPYPEPDQSSPFPPFHLLKIRSLLSSHLRLGLPSDFAALISPPKPCTHLFCSPYTHTTCSFHFILIDLITRIIFGKEYRSLRSSSCSVLHSLVTLSLLGLHIPLCTLLSNTLSLRPSHYVSGKVSHPYKITGKIIVLYILWTLLQKQKLPLWSEIERWSDICQNDWEQ